MSVLKGDGLFLRPIVRSDLEYLNNWKNKEEIYKYLGGGISLYRSISRNSG